MPGEPADIPAESGQARPAIYADITGQPGERRDIIPRALQRENIRGTVATFPGLQWRQARYHGLRLPFYPLAHIVFAVIGFELQAYGNSVGNSRAQVDVFFIRFVRAAVPSASIQVTAPAHVPPVTVHVREHTLVLARMWHRPDETRWRTPQRMP